MNPASTWMPIYIGDYLGDTIGLTLAEHGAYLLTIMAYWRKGGPLTDEELTAICNNHCHRVSRFFVAESVGDHKTWRHKRIDFELSSANRWKSAQVARTEAARAALKRLKEPVTIPVTSHVTTPVTSPPSPSHKYKYSEESREVLKFLNKATGRQFRETDSSLEPIDARLKESGVTVDGIKLMITRQVKRWNGTKYEEYLRPQTLFGKEKFDGYYAPRELPLSQNDGRNNGQSFNRNEGTLNEGLAGEYANYKPD